MNIVNSTLAVKWAKQNMDALVTRPGSNQTIAKIKSFNDFEFYFSNFWEEILVTTGVNEKDFSLKFTKLVDIEVDFPEVGCTNEEYLNNPNSCPFCGCPNNKELNDDTVKLTDNGIKLPRGCWTCGKTWYDVFQLTKYSF